MDCDRPSLTAPEIDVNNTGADRCPHHCASAQFPAGEREHTSSGEARSERVFEIMASPNAKGFYKLVDKVIRENGKLDCYQTGPGLAGPVFHCSCWMPASSHPPRPSTGLLRFQTSSKGVATAWLFSRIEPEKRTLAR